jgi:hypothetical protein
MTQVDDNLSLSDFEMTGLCVSSKNLQEICNVQKTLQKVRFPLVALMPGGDAWCMMDDSLKTCIAACVPKAYAKMPVLIETISTNKILAKIYVLLHP